MTVLTPLAGLVALAALLPAAAALLAYRRVAAVRRTLRLQPPARRTNLLEPALAAAGVALLAAAAAQPALIRTSSSLVRRHVQAVFVLDVSRSMAASSSPRSPTRLDRAVAAAVRLRAAIPQVESGVLTLTDRVLPDLLPVADPQGFSAVAERVVRIETPPPRETSRRATSYDALAGIATGNVFAPDASRRIVVLLTDGESAPVDTGELARVLSPGRGYRFLALRFWRSVESVFDADGRLEAAYRPDPSGKATLQDLASALGGRSFEEGALVAAAASLRALVGAGPTARIRNPQRSTHTLAPYLAGLGLLVLLGTIASMSPTARSLASARR